MNWQRQYRRRSLPERARAGTASVSVAIAILAGTFRIGLGEEKSPPAPATPAVPAAPAPATPSSTPAAPVPVPTPPATTTPETAAPPNAELELTSELIASRRKQVEEANDLDDEIRKRAVEIYKQAQDQWKRAGDLSARTAELKKQAAAATERQTAAKADLASLKSKPEPEAPANASLAVLEQEVAKRQAELESLRKLQADLEAEPNRRANRRKEIRANLIAAPERMEEVTKQLEAAAPADEPPQVTQARRTELMARRKMLSAEAPALEAELALYDAEDVVDLLRLKRDLQSQEVERAAKRVEKLRALLNQRRREDTENALRQAQQQQRKANPLLQTYADGNTKLAEEARILTVQLESAEKDLQETRAALDRLEKEFEQTIQKVESIGLTSPIGLLLRKQRADLPDVRAHRRQSAERRDVIEQVQFKLFELDEERSLLADLDPAVNEILRSAENLSDDEKRDLEQSAREVLAQRRQFLDTANRSYVNYIDKLLDIDVTERTLIEQVEKYAQFIDERVLWTRSSRVMGMSELRRDRSLSRFLQFDSWRQVGAELYRDVLANPIPFLSAVLLFGALEYYRGRFRKELREIGNQVQRGTFSKFAPTMRAVMLTAILSLFGPSLVTYFAWRFGAISQEGDLAKAVSTGLYAVAASFWPLEFVRQCCRTDGLAEAHFGWSIAAVRLLRRRLRYVMAVGLPLLFLTVTLGEIESEQGRDGYERLSFIVAMLLGAVFIWSLLNPERGIIHDVVASSRGGWMERLTPVWQGLGILPPFLLGILAITGYFYTAQQFAVRIESTIWLFVGCLLLRGLLLRLVLVHRRRLSIAQARERRAAAEERTVSTSDAVATANINTETEKVADLAKISSQTQRLLNVALMTIGVVGFWWIWIDVLPALNFLDRWPLWTTTEQTTEEVISSGGQKTTRTIDKIEAVTVANLAAAILIAIMTFVSSRNVPGLLEMSVLQRLPVDAAGRYATTAIAKYLIVMVGVVLAGSAIGVGWSKIQWLATALTFGLAFGLQEIFANFVAGVIILFERPVRVGDVVTVGDVSGVVSRIRIRATTITNWDRKEYIVPNKEFITGRLLNWTLSDTMNRVVLRVGVAYGSDPNQARELLLEAAREQPTVLREPAPTATFEQFGDSTLDFTLNVFLPDLGGRIDVTHQLHTAVYNKFRAAGIEIAFPQRDIHIRSADGSSASHVLQNGAKTNGNPQAAENSHVTEEA